MINADALVEQKSISYPFPDMNVAAAARHFPTAIGLPLEEIMMTFLTGTPVTQCLHFARARCGESTARITLILSAELTSSTLRLHS